MTKLDLASVFAGSPQATDTPGAGPWDETTSDGARKNAAHFAELEARALVEAETKALEAQIQALNAASLEADRSTAAAAFRERQALEREECAQREERERAENEVALLRWRAEDAARQAEEDARIAASEKQDGDFHAFSVRITFEIENSGHNGKNPCSLGDLSDCEFSKDEEEGYAISGSVLSQVAEALATWSSHYRALGLIRNDDGEGTPRFHLVCRSEDEPLAPSSLLTFPHARLQVDALPGATLVISSSWSPINATMLYETLRERPASLGHWGGELTPELGPVEGEGRANWLSRAAMTTRTIERTAERWKRSGGNLLAFGLCGTKDERAVGNKPIEYLVPGLLPRGYTSLLLGQQHVGKTTLLGEIAAVIDSQCQSRRSVLGIEVQARGVSCIVSGEDGDDVINRRNDCYSTAHGDATSFVIDLNRMPWTDALEMLWGLPQLDFLALDPLRLLLEGDEDSSDRVSSLYKQLEALSRAKNCATLLAHHTGKKTPNALSGMLAASRGSSVITQRPRAAIGMLGRGADMAEIGIIKWNLPKEDMWGPVNVGTLFRQDRNTLVPVEPNGRRSVAIEGASNSLELIHAEVAHQNRLGLVLRRTGKSELFEQRIPKLAGMSRNMIRDGVTSLVAAGRLIDGPKGLQAVTDPEAVRS